MSEIRKTVLCDEHIRLGGKMVDFAGWYLPVQYSGLIEEHECVRSRVGFFDVSHMGEVFVRGPKSLQALEYLTTNEVSKLEKGQAQYSLLLYPNGGIVDDIIIYCLEKNSEYLVCVNASNAEKDFNWMLENNRGADIQNESNEWAQICIQGPRAKDVASEVLGSWAEKIPRFTFETRNGWHIARTGYTGEDGYEIFLPNKDAVSLWQRSLEAGKRFNALPIGLGARDTLRTEMKYALYGNEISSETSPLEAGLGWVVKMAKEDFIGKSALEEQKKLGIKRRLIGFKLVDKGIPRHDYPLFSFDNMEIGKVTSGTLSPTLREPIGIGFVKSEFAEIGKEFFVQIRGRGAKAIVVKTPFVNPKGE